MDNFFLKQQEEYEKLTCPICGCKPTFTILYGHKYKTNYCIHAEMERMIEEAENRLCQESNSNSINSTGIRIRVASAKNTDSDGFK